MKEEQFIKDNSTTWKELEDTFALLNKKGMKALPSAKVKRFLHIFRLSSHHLAYARTHYPQSNVVTYLNSLIGKCHSYVYGVKKSSPKNFLKYITYEFPNNLKKYRLYVLGSFGFFFLGFVISLLMVLFNPNQATIFLSPSIVDGIKSGASGGGTWNYPLMSSQIMINNISVSLRAFVFGITLGLGTIYILFTNGTMLGSLTAIVYIYGKPVNFWSLILPHGVFELTAIFISGAAGLMLAKHLLIPGEYSRKHALIDGAKKSVSLVGGIVLMLVIAAIIEGFFTPLKIAEFTKLFFAAITAILLAIYLSIPYLIKDFKK